MQFARQGTNTYRQEVGANLIKTNEIWKCFNVLRGGLISEEYASKCLAPSFIVALASVIAMKAYNHSINMLLWGIQHQNQVLWSQILQLVSNTVEAKFSKPSPVMPEINAAAREY